MASPEKPLAHAFPLFQPENLISSLEKAGKIYARLFSLKDRERRICQARERSGIEVEKYNGKPLQCVAEIVKARFYDLEELEEKKKNPSKDAIYGTYAGWNTGYKFFPELVEMVDGETGSADDEDFNEDAYDVLATQLFEKWGVSGFGLDVYCDKPMLQTENGTFFLNEFIFEELIDEWEESPLPNVKVCFIIDELLIHAIKPFTGEWTVRKTMEEEYNLKSNERLIVGRWVEVDKW